MNADASPEFTETGAAYFPAYRPSPSGAQLVFCNFRNPLARRHLTEEDPLFRFDLAIYRHNSFAAEWPIKVDIPTALRGFRHVLGLSQVKFAEILGESRVNIERWEGGRARPFRGHNLALLSLLRGQVTGEQTAGQLLNIAAAAVCPHLTRPAAIYSGHTIENLLIDGPYDHRDLAPALLLALIDSQVLVHVDEPDSDINGQYIPGVAVRTIDRPTEPWESELNSIARRMHPRDLKLWMLLGERLGQQSGGDDMSPAIAGIGH